MKNDSFGLPLEPTHLSKEEPTMTTTPRAADLPWSAFEARHGLRQAELRRPPTPTVEAADGTPEAPLPTEHPED